MKKKLAIIAATAAFLAAAVPVLAAKPEKVDVCHIIEANVVIPFGPVMLNFGKEISVSENAVPAHEAHGDSTTFFGGEEAAGPIAAFKAAGAQLPAADCYVVVRP